MIIFNSIKNKKWSGSNFEITESGSLILSSNASLYHNISLTPGDYTIRIILKKISGEGGCLLSIESHGISLLSEKIEISDKKLLEVIKNIEINSQSNGTLCLKKLANTIGRTEIVSIRIQKTKEINNQVTLNNLNTSNTNNKNKLSLIIFNEDKINNNLINDIVEKNKRYDIELFIFNQKNTFKTEKYNIPVKYFFNQNVFFEYLEMFSSHSFIFLEEKDYLLLKPNLKIRKAIIYDNLGKIHSIELKNPIIFEGYLI
jgi:hypothetical protein